MSVGPAALEDRILSGSDRRLQLEAARGTLDLTPQRAMLMQVLLSDHLDSEVAEAATESLAAFSLVDLAEILDATANRQVLTYYATQSREPAVLESVIRNRNAGAEILALLLPKLPLTLVYLVSERQDALREDPALMELIGQRRDRAPRREPANSRAGKDSAGDDDQVDLGHEIEVDGATRRRRLTEAQIRDLPISVRLKLCRGAARDIRNIMIRDPNPSVAVAVLEFNSLSDSEIEAIAGNKNLAAEVLAVVVGDRQWPQRHAIALALVKNPKVQTGAAIRLLSGLSVRELGRVGMDRGVAESVRKQAHRLYRIKLR